jgi:hypothetical protein
MDNRDYIFEIHFQGKFTLCVGKKSDSDDLQMQTAQFYSSIRDQWESNASSSSSPPPPQTPSSNTISVNATPQVPSTAKQTGDLRRKRSIYRRPPQGRDNEDKDLHELYAFTGEKIGEGISYFRNTKEFWRYSFRSIRTSRWCYSKINQS